MYSRFALIACCAILVLGVLSQFAARFILDDAFMFVRYADSVLAGAKISWNPAGEPTYGLTSWLFLSLVLPIRFFLPADPALTAGLASLLGGILFLVSLAILVKRHTDAGPGVGRLLMLLSFGSLAASIYYLAGHFVGGMDTLFACAFLSIYILVARRHERTPSTASIAWMGLWGGLAFSARPDLLIYSFFVPAAIAFFGADSKTRCNGVLILLLTVVAVGAQVLFAWHYFNTPLPLPFYAKGTQLYGAFLAAQYRFVPAAEFLSFLASYWYLWTLIGADLMLGGRQWKSRVSAVDKGLLMATCLFVLYYLFFVLQIMPYHQRFYYPTLPALLFLAAQSATRLIDRIPPLLQRELQPFRFLATLVFLGFLFPAAVSVARGLGSQFYRDDFLNFDVRDTYLKRGSTYWFRLDEFSLLPDDLVMATTEVGMPAAMNPHKTIVDLTGLNETTFARYGFSPDYLFQEYRPDLIYMPHPHYQRVIEQISNHPHFIAHYEYFPAATLGVEMGVALDRDSRYYPEMRALVTHGPGPPP